jgi:hypothetical protein
MPDGWPPKEPRVGKFLRERLALILFVGSILTIGLVAWTLLELRAVRASVERIERVAIQEK